MIAESFADFWKVIQFFWPTFMGIFDKVGDIIYATTCFADDYLRNMFNFFLVFPAILQTIVWDIYLTRQRYEKLLQRVLTEKGAQGARPDKGTQSPGSIPARSSERTENRRASSLQRAWACRKLYWRAPIRLILQIQKHQKREKSERNLVLLVLKDLWVIFLELLAYAVIALYYIPSSLLEALLSSTRFKTLTELFYSRFLDPIRYVVSEEVMDEFMLKK